MNHKHDHPGFDTVYVDEFHQFFPGCPEETRMQRESSLKIKVISDKELREQIVNGFPKLKEKT